MNNAVLIIGVPGSGKSTSMRNLDPKSTFIISVIDKPFPFPAGKKDYKKITGWGDRENNYYASDNYLSILKCIDIVDKERPDIKVLILDDWQYIMGNEFMNKAKVKGYEKFADMALQGWAPIVSLLDVREDLITFVLTHSEIGMDGVSRCKTLGKMIAEKGDIEGRFITSLHTRFIDGQYMFQTQMCDNHIARSPMGMFEQFIPNDLQLVVNKINEYYKLDKEIVNE